MLVLTRKLGEVVCVGRDVEIMVVAVNSGKVRLGFRAPRDVVIQRSEVASRAKCAESDEPPAHPVLARASHEEFAATPPLRVLRQLGSV